MRNSIRCVVTWIGLASLAALPVSCRAPQPAEAQAAATPPSSNAGCASSSAPVHSPLDNVITVTPTLISGSAPHDDAGFIQLKAMGIRTIISVDGAEPDVAAARAHGMRYVHLPMGYHGLSVEQKLRLARAARDLPGPVYVHCHHGKHRGPAAAATAAVLLGRLSVEDGMNFLRTAGTSPDYPGLFAAVRESAPVRPGDLDAVSGDFPESSPPPTTVHAMVELQSTVDHLDAIRKAGWRVPPDHPDLVPQAEVDRVRQLFAALTESIKTSADIATMATELQAGLERATELQSLHRRAASADELSAALSRLLASCKDCHVRHRDRR